MMFKQFSRRIGMALVIGTALMLAVVGSEPVAHAQPIFNNNCPVAFAPAAGAVPAGGAMLLMVTFPGVPLACPAGYGFRVTQSPGSPASPSGPPNVSVAEAAGGIVGGGALATNVTAASSVTPAAYVLMIRVILTNPFTGADISYSDFPYSLTVTSSTTTPSFPIAILANPSPPTGQAPLTIRFEGRVVSWPYPFCQPSPDADRDFAWAWDFGDGATATGRVVTKTYQSPGNFTVTLTSTHQFQGGPGSCAVGVPVSIIVIVTQGQPQPPISSSVDLWTDRGCQQKGDNPIYRVGDAIVVRFRIEPSGPMNVTLTDILPNGQQNVILQRTLQGNQAYQFQGRIVPPLGRETLSLSVMPVGGDVVYGAECSFTVTG